MDIIKTLSEELKLPQKKLEATVALIDEGNTIPFIARYRKEVTGSMDDTVLRQLDERLRYLRSMDKRREEIRTAVDAAGKLTPELSDALENAASLTELEDLYRPFRPKRQTRASIARDRGLEGLAALLSEQRRRYDRPLEEIAADYINEEKGVPDAASALNGACDILAEAFSDNAEYRKEIRRLTFRQGVIVSKKLKDESSPYEMYYDYSEKVREIPEHRILALNRAEKEEFVRVSIEIPREIPLNALLYEVVTDPKSPAFPYVMAAFVDGYDRLIAPSIEREIRNELFERASEGAIRLFAENLRNLLMQAPLKGKTVLGLDPGYRTGCKLAVVDKTGRVLDTAVIYPTKPHEKVAEARAVVTRLVERYSVDVISIGNGTASGESEMFIADLLPSLPAGVKYAVVSEAGASVYSASRLGAEEFPDYDVTERSAVSIARRLQDPLAELIKIDPKSIGVGQYQHDMKQAPLDEALDGVVESCVNAVGVDINTASHALLSHVAGINASVAKNIVKYREENGEFRSRAQILKVPRLGAKAFEQCAGFLRVSGSEEILDNTGVHPESYPIARKLLQHYRYSEEDVRACRLKGLLKTAEKEGIGALCSTLEVGEPTLRDIIAELEKPGRDIRDSLPQPEMRTAVLTLDDLKPGMTFTGTVRNVIDFGAFVDIGVHQDGLVHVTQMRDRFVRHPSEVVSVGDRVQVKVLDVDRKKGRISLTMKL